MKISLLLLFEDVAGLKNFFRIFMSLLLVKVTINTFKIFVMTLTFIEMS